MSNNQSNQEFNAGCDRNSYFSLGKVILWTSFLPITGLLVLDHSAAMGTSSGFAPHRAVYEFELGEFIGTTGISGLSGRFLFEVTGSECEGYATNYRFLVKSTDRSGSSTIVDSRSTGYENIQDGEYQFFHKLYINEKLQEESSGTAARNDQEFLVNLSKPEPTELTFDKTTLFPMEHTLKTIVEAQLGTSFMTDTMYDGGENGKKLYSITTVIGSPGIFEVDEEIADVENGKLLVGNRFWPVTFTFFDLEEEHYGEQTPDFEVMMKLHENGVSSDLDIKYTDYSLNGKLTELDFLSSGECDL